MIRRATAVAALSFCATLASLGACTMGPPPVSGTPDGGVAMFLAVDRDFAGYDQWARVSSGDSTIPGHPTGSWTIYRNRALPAGASAYEAGTIVVKEVRAGPAPADWELFAMVKRGGDYNADGARGWEYFVLRLSASGEPVVTSRGESPSTGDEYMGGDSEDGCNGCHGRASAAGSDYLLGAGP